MVRTVPKQSEAGKGSKQRPGSGYADGWERIWGKACGCITCFRDRAETYYGLPVELARMIVCAKCGNKRCPHANNHRNECTGSNETGQKGSAYE
jgi:hypothetical protein